METTRVSELDAGEELKADCLLQCAEKTAPQPHSLSAFPTGGLLACAVGNEIYIYSTKSYELICKLAGHSGEVLSLAFCPDGNSIASGSKDTTVRVWDTASFRERSILTGHTEEVVCVAWSPDGKTLASTSRHSPVKLWESGQLSRDLLSHQPIYKGEFRKLAFSPNGKFLALLGCLKLEMYNLTTGLVKFATTSGHGKHLDFLLFSVDGKSVFVWPDEGTQSIPSLYDAKTGDFQLRKGDSTRTGAATCGAMSPDGCFIVSGHKDKSVRIWGKSGSECIVTLKGHSHEITDVCFSVDGKLIASSSYDKSVVLWDRKGKELWTFEDHDHAVLSVSLHGVQDTSAGTNEAVIPPDNQEDKQHQSGNKKQMPNSTPSSEQEDSMESRELIKKIKNLTNTVEDLESKMLIGQRRIEALERDRETVHTVLRNGCSQQ